MWRKGMCMCLRVIGRVGGLCWRVVPSHVCSYVGFLTPGMAADGIESQRSAQQAHWHKPLATRTQWHTHTHKKANEYRWSSSFLGINLLFKDQSCKLKYYSVTFAYSVSIFKNPHVVSDNMHWQVSLPQGCSQGRTTGMSAWLGANTWGPAMVNKISE